MRTINITFTVSERQYEYLCLAKSEQPDPQRIKMMLLSQAVSLLRRMGEQVMDEARNLPRPEVKLAMPPKTKPKRVRVINEGYYGLTPEKPKRERKPNKVLTNSTADVAVPFTPTPLEDYEF